MTSPAVYRKRRLKCAAGVVGVSLFLGVAGDWNAIRVHQSTASAQDAGVTLIPPVTVEAPTVCMSGGAFNYSNVPPGWSCDPVPVGGYLPGEFVVIPHRGAFLVSADFLNLVAKYFQPQDQRWAVRSAACESEFKADADNHRGYGGYWQHKKSLFPAREAAAIKWWAARGVTWTGRGVFDGESNAATTAWLLATSGKSQWSCSGRG